MRRAMPILASLALSSITLPAMAGPIATATAYTQYSLMNSSLDPTADLSAIHTTFDSSVSTSFSGNGTTSETDTRGPNLFQISVTAAVSGQGQAHSFGGLDYTVQFTNISDQDMTVDLWWSFSSSIGSTATIDLGGFQTAGFRSFIDGTLVGDTHYCTVSDSGFQADMTGTFEDHAGQRTCYISAADSSLNGGPIVIGAGDTITGFGSLEVFADATVPEPATAILLGLGVLSLVGVRSIKRI
jgi:hypothetical protein